MYEAKIIEHFSKVPAFSLADMTQLIPNRLYAKKVLHMMVRTGKISRVRRDLYTFHRDPFLVATFLYRPSCISGFSALSYHHKITQIPKEVFCVTPKATRKYFFVERIVFHHAKSFFGFETGKYMGFDVPIATPEKALIDSIGHVPLSVVEEAFEGVDADLMVSYLKRIKKGSVVKRVGYLLEERGHDVYPALKRYTGGRYVRLDPFDRRKRATNSRWRLIL